MQVCVSGENDDIENGLCKLENKCLCVILNDQPMSCWSLLPDEIMPLLQDWVMWSSVLVEIVTQYDCFTAYQ